MSESNTPSLSAYELLTRPTLELSDAEVTAIVADLQTRRLSYVNSAGKTKDDPRPKKPKAEPVSPLLKASTTADILAELDLGDL